jgi:hypothetical protein
MDDRRTHRNRTSVFLHGYHGKHQCHGVAEKQTINFTAPTIVGGTVLPAGHYSVTHQMNGQTHIMTFKKIGGKSEAQTKCSLVPLKEKASNPEQRYLTNAQNQRVLQEITFEGDKATHVLAQ